MSRSINDCCCWTHIGKRECNHLATMQRADENIDQLLVELSGTFHRLCQSSIDEEQFDEVAGSEALCGEGY